MKPSPTNPWSENALQGWGTDLTVICDERGRLSRIKQSTNVPWLRSVAAWQDSQISVRLAAQRRLRKLAKQRPA